MRLIRGGSMEKARTSLTGEYGFTLIEVMIGIVLLTVGLLAVAGVLPPGLALGLYGKDQTRAANLAQQKMEYLKAQPTSSIAAIVGDYLTTTTEVLDQNGQPTTPGLEYFDRDVQVQIWTWNGTQFVVSGTPYTVPSSGPYVYRVSVAVSWNVNGYSSFQYPTGKSHGKGKSSSTVSGCVVNSASVPTGAGCVQVSTFITP